MGKTCSLLIAAGTLGMAVSNFAQVDAQMRDGETCTLGHSSQGFLSLDFSLALLFSGQAVMVGRLGGQLSTNAVCRQNDS